MASLLTANGYAVSEGEIVMPRLGAWTATATVEQEVASTGAVQLAVGATALLGYAYAAGTFALRSRMLLVGGKGGALDALVVARAFRPAPVRVVVEDALQGTGEGFSTLADAVTLARFLPRWTRLQRPGGTELQAVADALGVSWRFADDGGLWMGPETWPALDVAHEVVEHEPARRRIVFAGDDVHKIRPGVTVEGRKVDRVCLSFSAASVRAEVDYL